ncbi:MAG: hypothetical protein Q8P31_04905 [Bacillota bacterium]|nr:hypothetical protein [Bacillota bacterium]
MRANRFVIEDLDRLLEDYEKVVEKELQEGHIKGNTAETYIIHARQFVRWCKGEFDPGSRNR